jgi:hypothetical protein
MPRRNPSGAALENESGGSGGQEGFEHEDGKADAARFGSFEGRRGRNPRRAEFNADEVR